MNELLLKVSTLTDQDNAVSIAQEAESKGYTVDKGEGTLNIFSSLKLVLKGRILENGQWFMRYSPEHFIFTKG